VSFLAPLFLLGGLAVALPVLFHLIRRTTRERLPFSSLMFLQTTPPRVTRRSRLEHILLLLLRCAVLVLLALGFARPLWQRALPTALSAAPARLVVLVDTSASMRRSGLWAEAQAQLAAALAKVGSADQVAVFTFDRQVRPLVSFDQWAAWNPAERVALATRQLSRTSPSWAATHLDHALIAAAEALEDAARQEQPTGPRRILLISDVQAGSRLDRLQGYEWPRGIEVQVQPVKARRTTNAGLHLVAEREETQAGAADVPLRVRVDNSADARREQFQLGWARADGQLLPGTLVEVYVPPGHSRVVAMPRMPEQADRVRLAGDDEDFDNTAYVVALAAEQVQVLYLGTESAQDPAQGLYYLSRAFQQTRRHHVQVIVPGPEAAESMLQTSQVHLVIATEPVPERHLALAQQALAQGRTVLWVTQSPAAAAPLAGLLGLSSVSIDEAPSDRYALLAEIDFTHPLFAPFADPRFSDFTKIHFWKHRRLATNNLPGARVLARFDNGDPALVQVPVGPGTLLVLTSGWHPADSQLARSSKFVPLLYALLELSGELKPRLIQYVVGDPVQVPASLLSSGRNLAVHKPDGSSLTLAPGETTFTQTDFPGIYTVSGGSVPYQFAVNIAPEESKTAPAALEEWERLGVPLRAESDHAAQQRERQRALVQASELESRQKLWRWLLLTALVVLVMETFLAARVTRRARPAEAPASA
jgi:hypothetical protein